MKGIKVEKDQSGECLIIYIEELSDELKQEIKNELISICHGDTAIGCYEFNEVLEELLARYPKEENKRIGFIGEFLLNIIIRKFLPDIKIVSLFFNMEQRDVKKGFDILFIDISNGSIYFTESKAGKMNDRDKDVNLKIIEKIDLAKRDLIKKFTNKQQIGQVKANAINNLRICLDNNDEKKTVINLLNFENFNTIDKNVLLGGIIFHDVNEKFDKLRVIDKYIKILDKESFYRVKIIAIQKSTYQKIYKFFKEMDKQI